MKRVVAVAALLTAGLALWPAATLAATRTRVVQWSPFATDGGLRSGLISTPKFGGDCWTGSFVLHRGYRCVAGNRIYDPCFSDPMRDDAVVCVPDPFTSHVIRLRVSGDMNDSYSAPPGVAWALRLAGGLKCSFIAGGATNADSAGRRLNYFCSNSRSVLWGNPIRRGSTWRIRLTRSSEPGAERLVAIRVAYIGAT
jgi:hypothetical protein